MNGPTTEIRFTNFQSFRNAVIAIIREEEHEKGLDAAQDILDAVWVRNNPGRTGERKTVYDTMVYQGTKYRRVFVENLDCICKKRELTWKAIHD